MSLLFPPQARYDHLAAQLVKLAADATPSYALAGKLYLSASGWLLLSVPNGLVRATFDAMQEPGIELPLSQGSSEDLAHGGQPGKLEAHISVMRPEEIEQIGGPEKISERGHSFHYQLGGLKTVVPAGWAEVSRVWLLSVYSPELQQLRRSYGLTPLPQRNGHVIPFHCTIAIRRKGVLYANDQSKSGGHVFDTSSRVQQLAGHEGSLSEREAHGVSELRGTRDYGVSGVAEFCEFSDGHGRKTGQHNAGTSEERRGIYADQLFLGGTETAKSKQAEQLPADGQWADADFGGLERGNGDSLCYDSDQNSARRLDSGAGFIAPGNDRSPGGQKEATFGYVEWRNQDFDSLGEDFGYVSGGFKLPAQDAFAGGSHDTSQEIAQATKIAKSIHANKISSVSRVLQDAHDATDTDPTPAQVEAGNYKKGKFAWNGLTISIENPKGSVRRGVDKNNKPWQVTLKSTYGYFLGTVGKDKDHVDCLLADDLDSELVFVVNQIDPENGKLDEHKCVLGTTNEEDARKTYLANYEDGWQGLGSIAALTLPQFKWWLANGNMTKAIEDGAFAKQSADDAFWASPPNKEGRRCPGCNSLFKEVEPLPGVENCEVCERFGPPHDKVAAAGDKVITPAIKSKRVREEDVETCPHCQQEIGEKSHYVDDDGYEYHRGCIDAGPIGRVSESMQTWIQQARGKQAKQLDPSYDPKHPEECCPSCGARLERDPYKGTCNRCGEDWLEKAADMLPGVTLQPHQQRLADEAAQGPFRKLLYHSLGSGKSLSSLAIAEAAGGPYTAVTPAALRPNYEKEIDKWTDGETPHSVVSYTGVAKQTPTDIPNTLILDECFPAGTLIDNIPIEQYRGGEQLLSMNHHTGCLELQPVLRVSQRQTDEIAVVRLTDGVEIICTPNHPFYTPKDYIAADCLQPGDTIYKLEAIGYLNRRCRLRKFGYASLASVGMRRLRSQIRNLAIALQSSQTLFRKVQESCLGCRHAQNDYREQGQDPGSYAKSQSNAGCELSSTSSGYVATNRAQTNSAWRQWQRADETRTATVASDRLASQRSGLYREISAAVQPAERLQNRRGRTDAKDSHRNRRQISQLARPTSNGCQEGSILKECRVDCVQIYQRGSGPEFERLCPTGTVYDLTVARNHNFFANGYLVHNSHRLRNPGSAQTQHVADLAAQTPNVVMLSGSPVVNHPHDIAPLMSMLTGNQMSPEEFDQEFIGEHTVQPGLMGWLQGVEPATEPALVNQDKLKSMLKGHVDYFKPSDMGVERQDERHVVPMSSQQQGLYQAFWDQLPWLFRWKLQNSYPLTHRELTHMSSFLSGPRQVSLSTLPFMRGNADAARAFQESPKLQKAMELAQQEYQQNPDAKVVSYSNFVTAGLRPYSAGLTAAGIPNAIFHGGLNDVQRKQIVSDFNAGKIKHLLLGPSASEGISLKGTTALQLLDPHWNDTRSDQAAGRAIRFDSHNDLPEELRKVKVQRLVSELPQGLWSRLWRYWTQSKPSTPTTDPGADTYLERMGARKTLLNEQLLQVLREVGTQPAQ